MKFEDAKDLLLEEGYRIIGEDFEDDEVYADVEETNMSDGDTFTFIEQGLGDEGFDPQETADIMTNYAEKINELIGKGVSVEDIVKIIAYENCDEAECEGEECDNLPAEVIDVPVDEATISEGKSRYKSDKFSHKERVALRRKKKCEYYDDDDEDLDNEDDFDYDKYDFKPDDMDESLEDVPGLTREPRGQQGTDDWSDFKEDFRAKTLFLKKALTPKFVSGIIKDSDFEVDEKEIKEFAFKIIEDVFGTKDPVENIQRRIRKHFVG